MKTYLKIHFSSEGSAPSDVISKLEKLGWKPVIGEYDFMMESGLGEGVGESYKRMVDKLHEALKGANVRYSLYSRP
ncbi:MAG: hypothetical protein HZB92_02755 [Euryarchaeota archaeon]|nr:hypothetical protein [Euryarchaeota archaeon]